MQVLKAWVHYDRFKQAYVLYMRDSVRALDVYGFGFGPKIGTNPTEEYFGRTMEDMVAELVEMGARLQPHQVLPNVMDVVFPVSRDAHAAGEVFEAYALAMAMSRQNS